MYAILVLMLAGQCWGVRPAPAVAGPRLSSPLVAAWRAHQPPAVVVMPTGPGGCCSSACTCGCNDGQPCVCGNSPSPEAGPVVGQDLPTGVDPSRLGGRTKYTRNGREISRAEAVSAVEQLVDDSARPRLTIIGAEAERKAVREVLAREAWLGPLVLVQDYGPDAWAVQGHAAKGTTVYLQRPDGAVLVREQEVSAGGLAALVARIKAALGLGPKPDPKTPDDKTPPAPVGPDGRPAPTPAPWTPWAILAAALAWLLLQLNPKPKEESAK